jgi:ABC-type spermidine/putrescine transport system permease subunit II
MRFSLHAPSLWIGFTAILLCVTYAFLYVPIVHVAMASVSSNTMWPYPPRWTTAAYTALIHNRVYLEALINSVIVGFATAALSTGLATVAIFGMMRYPGRHRGKLLLLYLAPLFVADIVLGISTMVFTNLFMGIGGNLAMAILANAVRCFTYAFLIIAVQLYRYDWRLNDAAMVFGATPMRAFREVTLPLASPALFSAALSTFILSFNNLEISFYLLGATPTLPAVAWGTLRYGIRPELFAMTTLINIAVIFGFAVILISLRVGRHRRLARVEEMRGLT